jgi:anaerobic selenocysteine-containing dehydrogenase
VRWPADFPVNRGRPCHKGWTAPALLNTPDRPLSPMTRDAAGALGPDVAGVFGGGRLINEKSYPLGKFARLALSARDQRGLASATRAAIGRRTRAEDVERPCDAPHTAEDRFDPSAQTEQEGAA